MESVVVIYFREVISPRKLPWKTISTERMLQIYKNENSVLSSADEKKSFNDSSYSSFNINRGILLDICSYCYLHNVKDKIT